MADLHLFESIYDGFWLRFSEHAIKMAGPEKCNDMLFAILGLINAVLSVAVGSHSGERVIKQCSRVLRYVVLLNSTKKYSLPLRYNVEPLVPHDKTFTQIGLQLSSICQTMVPNNAAPYSEDTYLLSPEREAQLLRVLTSTLQYILSLSGMSLRELAIFDQRHSDRITYLREMEEGEGLEHLPPIYF